jgi:4-hydroxy-tetrahydrodipicolinate synthase
MPFSAGGEIDEDSLRREVEWAIGCGVAGLALALASDFPRLSPEERSRVTRLCSEQARGRVPLVVSAGAESGYFAAELARRAEDDGANALMVLPPVFDDPSTDGIELYYRQVADASSLPLVVQDTPASRMPWGVITRLVEDYPGRIALKEETPPTAAAVERAVTQFGDRMPVFGGSGGIAFYQEMLRGSAGTMPGCVLPELFVKVSDAFDHGDRELARRCFSRLVPFLAATGMPGRWLAFYREALVLRGVFSSAAARAPQIPLTPHERDELRELLIDLEIEVPGQPVLSDGG